MTTAPSTTNGEASTAIAIKQMSLPGFKSSATGLVANKTLTAEQWEDAGQVLGHIEQRLSWYLGDWLLAGESGGYLERGKLEEACERFGSFTEVKLCTVTDCPSWAWRFGFHPETAERKYPHLINAQLIERVVSKADAIVGSDSAADIIEYLKQQQQKASKSPPSASVTTSEATSQEAVDVL